MATISSIVYQPEDQTYESGHIGDYIRVPVESAELIADHGIKGDRKAGRNPNRQLNLLSSSWVAAKGEQGYLTKPGQFGEQLVVDGLVLEDLGVGTQLQLGNQAKVEITLRRHGCERLEAAQRNGGLANTSVGVLARVLKGGLIRVGDDVLVLDSAGE